ncbi:MAG: hypothetical protein JSU66_07805 [Deltaproteobacteria bacterium]|nr:MAG: hypothetical protein JSU66_07805 [Deltaproteobacteria bacterium]
MGSSLVAGASRVELAAPLGLDMMGYGARTEPAAARHDPLFARALYASDGSDILIVELDLCLLAPSQADWIRDRIREQTGLPPERILVGCIHTHSAPDVGLGELLAGREAPPHVKPLLEAGVEAARRAHAGAAPARLGLGRAVAAIGRNRRCAAGPLDDEVLVARVDREDGAPLAVLYVHGCHPTALGHDNLAYSADWPGAAAREIEAALPGALALFALGAHADVDPRTRGLLDLAVEEQSVGVTFEAMEALGRELGRAVAVAAGAIETQPRVPVGAASARVELPVHGAESGAEAHAQALAARRAEAFAALGLAPDAQVRTGELFRLTQERTRGLDADERRERIARARLYLRDRTASRFAGGRAPSVEVQVLRIGDALLLGIPAEPTVDVGIEWKRRAPSPHAAVISIANGWLRYLPHPRNFDEPLAHQKYEVLMSTFVPDAAERLLDAATRLAGDLWSGAKGGNPA